MKAWRALRLALAFLTIVPVPLGDEELTDADLAASRFAYPVVGLLIGVALALLGEALDWRRTPPMLVAFLLIVAEVTLTGGLHLDGLADTLDGLFLGGGPERRLAVMRDPHVGSFGVMALVLVLLGKFAALTVLAGHDRSSALIVAAVVGRSLILVVAGLAGYARPEGTGRLLIGATTSRDAVWASILAVAVGLVVCGSAGLVAALVVIGFAWGLARLARRRLGGVTGDLLGTVVELGELGVLFVLAMTVGSA